jgi:hypothetical protein
MTSAFDEVHRQTDELRRSLAVLSSAREGALATIGR